MAVHQIDNPTEQRADTSERLTRIQVRKLFGRLDHDIPLSNDGIIILHGPNGTGKTTILKAVAELSKSIPHWLLKVPFEELTLTFESGHRLVVAESEKRATLSWYSTSGKKAGEQFVLPRLFGGVPLVLRARKMLGKALEHLSTSACFFPRNLKARNTSETPPAF